MTDIGEQIKALWTSLARQVESERIPGVNYRCTATLTEVGDNLRLATTWTPIGIDGGTFEQIEKENEPMNDKSKPFESWAIIELFGHNLIAGYVTEQIIAGTAFVRVDVPTAPDKSIVCIPSFFTKIFGPAAIYAITPTNEDTARQAAANLDVRPVSPWIVPDSRRELPPLTIDDAESQPPPPRR